jgi:hypothetical protein
MRRLLALFLMIAAALVATSPTAGATTPRHGFVFGLRAHGFYVEARGSLGSGGVRLSLDRRGEVAYYYTWARVGAGTVRARLGRLGSLDLRFAPADGELGCGGPAGWQRGTFKGSIDFRGEQDYADIDVHRAAGWFQTRPARCGARGRTKPPARASRLPEVAETGAELEGRTGTRLPFSLFDFFSREGRPGQRAVFAAFRDERREGMLIERGAQVYGGVAAFEWDLAGGTARVEPPAPFTGRAFYRRGGDGRPARWSGSLRAPVLGGKPMRLTGAAFAPFLGPAH